MRTRLLRSLLLTLITTCLLPLGLRAQELPSIAEKTDGMEAHDGFLPFYWDAADGRLYLEVPRLDEDLLYVVSLPAGLGSNDIGLDRGQLGGEQVVRFERVGPKVLLVTPNLRYRADTENAAERRAVTDAFAEGVVWGFTAVAETGERVLVDATDFVVRDAHGVVQRLRGTGQGSFRLDESRSAVYLPRTKAFPKNTELEARLTFTGDDAGGYVRSVAADPSAVTLRVRHSFVELPGPGFTPRRLDPRSGYFGISYQDYATPIGEELTQRFIVRHRLACADAPGADGLCTPTEPIVYHLDPGTPEPVRSALLDGARWWNEAFEAAGYRDAYRVEMLPEDADPMDVRYNVIQWVHRSTRGWSYGASVVDPRTGEIIKGHVSLGSLRVRQDYLLAEGMLAPYEGETAEGFDPAEDPMLAMALARIRQLSAHEVGHTLGIAHNFAASVNDRASVMDYPAPLAMVAGDAAIDLSAAYDTGIGEWDAFAVRYGYTDLSGVADEQAALEAILQETRSDGYLFITDADARPAGAAHPYANLWDNGTDMVASLEREMAVREQALTDFSEAAIRLGRPMATLEEALVPLYLRHRYQVEATVKMVGGQTYSYALRGDDQAAPAPVPGDDQRAALGALLATLTPEALALPPNVRDAIPPRPPSYGATRELFEGYSGLPFDAYAPAEVASALVLGLLAHPERAARLVYQADMDPSLPGLEDVFREVTSALSSRPALDAPRSEDPYLAELGRIAQDVWIDALLDLAADPDAAPAVRAQTTAYLYELQASLGDNLGRDFETGAARRMWLDRITRFLERSYEAAPQREAIGTPPGSPIGQGTAPWTQRQQARAAWLTHHADAACTFGPAH